MIFPAAVPDPGAGELPRPASAPMEIVHIVEKGETMQVFARSLLPDLPRLGFAAGVSLSDCVHISAGRMRSGGAARRRSIRSSSSYLRGETEILSSRKVAGNPQEDGCVLLRDEWQLAASQPARCRGSSEPPHPSR